MYLIPKSARNVKMEIFKGINVADLAIICLFVVGALALLLGIIELPNAAKYGGAAGLLIILVILMFPSPIVPDQKMYQSFKIIYGYLGSIKVYRRVVRKHGK